MIQTLNQYKDYFKTLAQDEGLDFVFGGIDRVLNRQNMDIKYPVLWLGIPEIRRVDNGSLSKLFDGWICVLQDSPIDDIDEQDTILNDLEAKVERIVTKMTAAHLAKTFLFDAEDVVSFAKTKNTADDLWGWFMEFKLIGNTIKSPDCL
jgi:hypothetical protein